MRISCLVACCLIWAATAHALTLEGANRWAGDRTFAETVRVAPDASLTIAPHSRVRFTRGGLEVSGRLIAEQTDFSGTGWDGILLKGTDATTRLSDVRIHGAKTGVKVQGGAPVLTRLTLTGNDVGVEMRGQAAGVITGCRFEGNRKVGLFLKEESTTVVRDNVFAGSGRYGAYIYRAVPAEFGDNRFSDNPTGLMIAYFGSDPLIERNLFTGNETAVKIDRAARPTLRGNRFGGNRTGLSMARRADPQVVGNRFEENATAVLITFSSYPRIEANDFAGNRMAIRLESQSAAWERDHGDAARAGETVARRSAFAGRAMRPVTTTDRQPPSLDGTVAATGNWWGEAGTRELAGIGMTGNPSFIHDGRDERMFRTEEGDFPMDRVRFTPWSRRPLTNANGESER